MKTVIVYDSVYNNTEEIANSMGEAIGTDAIVIKAGEAELSSLESVELLIVGSPTYGGQPTPEMKKFLNKLTAGSLNGISVAGFDTRVPAGWVKLFGFAARKILKKLQSRGGNPVMKPEGFYVSGTRGPLVDGESKRAADWAKDVVKTAGK
jgi:flavodoxin